MDTSAIFIRIVCAESVLPKRWYNIDVVLTDDFPRR